MNEITARRLGRKINVKFIVDSYDDYEYTITEVSCPDGMPDDIYLDSFCDEICAYIDDELRDGAAIKAGLM